MSNLLVVKSSLFAAEGESSRLADAFVARWRLDNPGGRVVERDLARDPVPHLDGPRFAALTARPQARTPEQAAMAALSDALVDELRSADVVVLGVPLYNFGIPSQLKAWIDHVARAGVTFRYTEGGPVGLLTGKRVVVVASRGGRYAGSPLDTQTDYLRDVLAFLGMDEVEFVYAEGLAIDAASKAAARTQAEGTLARLAARMTAQARRDADEASGVSMAPERVTAGARATTPARDRVAA